MDTYKNRMKKTIMIAEISGLCEHRRLLKQDRQAMKAYKDGDEWEKGYYQAMVYILKDLTQLINDKKEQLEIWEILRQTTKIK